MPSRQEVGKCATGLNGSKRDQPRWTPAGAEGWERNGLKLWVGLLSCALYLPELLSALQMDLRFIISCQQWWQFHSRAEWNSRDKFYSFFLLQAFSCGIVAELVSILRSPENMTGRRRIHTKNSINFHIFSTLTVLHLQHNELREEVSGTHKIWRRDQRWWN